MLGANALLALGLADDQHDLGFVIIAVQVLLLLSYQLSLWLSRFCKNWLFLAETLRIAEIGECDLTEYMNSVK